MMVIIMDFEETIDKQTIEIQSLKAQIISYQAENNLLQKRCEQYLQAYEQMDFQLKELIRNRFGKKSERYIDPEHPQQRLFSEGDKFSVAEEEGNKIADITIAAHTRKKQKKAEKEIPVRIEIIPVPEDKKQCACGACKGVISYEIKRLMHYQPAVYEIIEQRREVIACNKETQQCDGKIITAPTPLHVLPKVKATEEFLSFLVVSKLDDRQPLYHLEKQLSERHGMDCSRQTMARWMIDLMFPLQPVWNLMKDSAIEYDIASCDATSLQVLNEPGRAAETKSYVYCIRGGPPEKSVILYEYNEKEHKKFVYDWFAGFSGYLHVDGDNYKSVNHQFYW